MEVDIIPLQVSRPMFDRDCPAASLRGKAEEVHGSAVDGGRFFVGDVPEDFKSVSGGLVQVGKAGSMKPTKKKHAAVLEVAQV